MAKKVKKTAKTTKSASFNACSKCTGLCCQYFALPLDNPTERADYENIRWYLAHENISVFVEDGDWFLNVKNKCRHLCQDSYTCKIYENRPPICRKYKSKNCDFTDNEYDYELHFTDDKQMEQYIKVKFDNNKLERKKK